MSNTTVPKHPKEEKVPTLEFQNAALIWINDGAGFSFSGGPVRARMIHICPVCMHGCSLADLTDFINDGDYWLECSTCGVEWNIGEEPSEVLERLQPAATKDSEREEFCAR